MKGILYASSLAFLTGCCWYVESLFKKEHDRLPNLVILIIFELPVLLILFPVFENHIWSDV